jgi:prepilin-type N-terminal cleavage/methylation domain-containing protein
MPSSPFPERARAFTLIEVMVVIVILTLLASGLALPIAAQLEARRAAETRRVLSEARETLLGFAAIHGRLPCPASESSAGEESFAAGGDASNGNCSNFHDGLLPGAALGLAPLDPQGFVRDAWGASRNRIRYAVFGAGQDVGGVTNPLTRAHGMRSATLPALAAEPHYLFICSTGASANASGCGPAANQLTRRAAFVLVSLAANAAATPSAGSDEARNLSGTPVFVYHEESAAAANAFDDIVTWTPVGLVVSRMVSAGLLP